MVREAVVVDGRAAFRISWGAVFAGVFVALGLWILLHTLGLAAGLTAINPDDPRSLRGVGIGTGLWSVFAPLVALFVGGLVGARTAGSVDRGTGAVHGAVLWGLTTVAGTMLVSMAIASAVGAGVRAGGTALGAAGAALSAGPMRIDADDVLAPINQRLRAQGASPVSANQLQEATKDVVREGVREGRVDRDMIVRAIVTNTGLDRADAEQVGARIESQFNQSLSELRHGALQAAEATGKALWAVFFALLLGLISSVAGALVGVGRRQRAEEEDLPSAPTPVRPLERHIPIEDAP